MQKKWEALFQAGTFAVILALFQSFYELHHFEAIRYRVTNSKIPDEFQGAKIIFLSDLHNTEYGSKNKDLLLAIEREEPDYIFIGGDMLVGRADTSFLPALSLVRRLARRYPVYYANGNHEYRLKIYPEKYGSSTYREYETLLKEAGVVYLCNESVKIRRKAAAITVTGLEIDAMYYQRGRQVKMSEIYLPSILGFRKKNEGFNILLAHNPLYFQQYAKWGADLVLSGHVHGGVMRLPLLGGVISPQISLFPKYDRGVFYEENSVMILSAGLGVHSIPFRLFNMPQMQIITLEGERD